MIMPIEIWSDIACPWCFVGKANLGRGEDMLRVVESVGLDQAAAQEVLASKQFADVVRADEQMAEQQGIRGVPFFVIGGYGLSGAQPSSTLAAAIQQARSSRGE